MESPGERRWWADVATTVARLFARPMAMFEDVREPVPHGRFVRLLASVRLPLWALTAVVVVAGLVSAGFDPHVHDRALGLALGQGAGGALAEALAVWMFLLVPLGLPALYFAGGLLAHLGLTLTGGAHRSVGASMRAYGLTVAPVLLVVGLLDLPLYLGVLPPVVFARIALLLAVVHFGLLTMALHGTHRVWVIRALLVAPLPVVLTQTMIWLRVLSVLPHPPGVEPPEPPDYALTDM